MTRPYSVAFKRKLVERLTGKDAISANSWPANTALKLLHDRCSPKPVIQEGHEARLRLPAGPAPK